MTDTDYVRPRCLSHHAAADCGYRRFCRDARNGADAEMSPAFRSALKQSDGTIDEAATRTMTAAVLGAFRGRRRR
ncbi:MAG: hypothetical protein R3B98_01655 [Hyphomonas sp.]